MIWPVTMLWLYNHDNFGLTFKNSGITVFFLLAMMVAYFPIKINRAPIFLINSVSLATFLIFGLFGEIVITQLAILVVLLRVKINKSEHYRIPLNLLLFLFVSIGSAFVYYSVASFVPTQFVLFEQNILQLYAYVFTSFALNQLTIYFINRYYYKNETKLLTEGFYFSLLSTSYTTVTGFLIVYLYQIFHSFGVLMMSIQIVAISISIKLYYSSKKTNETLHNINEIVQKMTGHFSRRDVINAYLNILPERFSIDAMALYDIVELDNIQLIHFYKQGKVVQTIEEQIKVKDCSIIEKALKKNELLSYNKAKEWQAVAPPELKDLGESLAVMPIIKNRRVTAVLLIVNNNPFAFDESTISTLNVLNSYFGIALDNAKYYEQVKEESLTDHLTGLPNLRQFENYIRSYQEDVTSRLTINNSLLIIDIDHFKRVNDQYGHAAGDEILVQIAELMQPFFENKGKVFRYGGEEFIVFLPTYSHESSVKIAESFRQLVEEHEFESHNYMKENHPAVSLKATVSMGVASYPEETDDIHALIRFADRAMYLGAKREGRNKVGIYQR